VASADVLKEDVTLTLDLPDEYLPLLIRALEQYHA